jgi:hypothetical protein
MLSVFPCHHVMARPQVVDGGEGLQVWRVTADIMNKQPTMSGPPVWGLGRVSHLPTVKNQQVTKCCTGRLRM